MKRNLTLAIEEEILDRARVMAVHQKRSLTAMVREYLQTMVREDQEKKSSLDRLLRSMKSKPLGVGRSSWKRDDLHAR